MQTLYSVQLCLRDMIDDRHPAFKESILKVDDDDNSLAIEEYKKALESFAARRMKHLHHSNNIQTGLSAFEAHQKTRAETLFMRKCLEFIKDPTKTDEVLSQFEKVRTFLTVLHTLFP